MKGRIGVLTLQHGLLAKQSPLRRSYARQTGTSMKRVALQLVVSAVVILLILALTAMSGDPHRPITAVRGEVEVLDGVSQPDGVTTAPPVEIIDAVCITNTPASEPC